MIELILLFIDSLILRISYYFCPSYLYLKIKNKPPSVKILALSRIIYRWVFLSYYFALLRQLPCAIKNIKVKKITRIIIKQAQET